MAVHTGDPPYLARQRQAFALAVAGRSSAEIAALLGCTRVRVWQYVAAEAHALGLVIVPRRTLTFRTVQPEPASSPSATAAPLAW